MGIRSTLGALGSPKGRKSPERRSLRDSVSFRLFLIAVLFLHGRKARIGGFAGQGTICGSKSVYSRQVVVSEKKYWALEMWINVWNSGGYSQTCPDGGRQLLSGPRWFAGSGNPLKGGLLRNLYFSDWSEREMRLRDRDCSALARVHPDGLEWLQACLRFPVRSAEERYERGDRPFSGSSSLEELGVSRGDMRSTGGRPRALRSLRPGPVFSRGESIRGEWPTRSLEKKRRREEPDHEGSGRAVLAPWRLGT